MFHIEIASLRDPATLENLKTRISDAAAIISAFEYGTEDAAKGRPYQSGLNDLFGEMFFHIVDIRKELHPRLTEAYNLGWDTVRLHRSLEANKNAK